MEYRAQEQTGQKVQVMARYKWRMGGVESIDFSMPTITVREPIEVVARPMPVSWDDFVRRAFDLLKRQKQLGQDMGPYITRRLACLLPKLRDPKFDDRYVDHGTIVRRQNWITKADPNWNHIIMHARAFLNRARNPRSSDQFVLLLLRSLDASIWGAIQFLDQEYNLRQSTMQPGLVVVKNWIHDQQKRPNNTYGACFSGSI